MNKYLVASGCSYTGGGGMNNLQLFSLEFPDTSINKFNQIYGEINWSDENFKKFLKPFLWPDKLGKLLNYTQTYNLASGGKGIHTTTNSLYHFIYNWQKDGKDVSELEIWFQIPNQNRLEIYVNDEDKHKAIITEMSDSNPIKKNFITNFFDEDYNLLTSIHETYKLKKYCDALGIDIYFIPWDDQTYNLDGNEYIKLQQRISGYLNDNNKSHFERPFTNINSVSYYNLDMMLNEMNPIFIENTSLNNYLERTFDGFYFQSKYQNVTADRHMTCEGHTEFAKLLKK